MGTRDRLLTPLRRTHAQDPTSQALAAVFVAAALSAEAFSPLLLDRVPLGRLQGIVDALKERHGKVRGVRPYRELHQVRFSRGTELVWARLDAQGRLTTLVTGPGALTARQSAETEAEAAQAQDRRPMPATPRHTAPHRLTAPAHGSTALRDPAPRCATEEESPANGAAATAPGSGEREPGLDGAAVTVPGRNGTAGRDRVPRVAELTEIGAAAAARREATSGGTTVTDPGRGGASVTDPGRGGAVDARTIPSGAVDGDAGPSGRADGSTAALVADFAPSAVAPPVGPDSGHVHLPGSAVEGGAGPELPAPGGALVGASRLRATSGAPASRLRRTAWRPVSSRAQLAPSAAALRRLAAAYLAVAVAAALLPYLSGTASGWLLLTAITPAIAWYVRTCGPTHALPPWFRALPLAAVGLAVLAGLRALPLLGRGLPWTVPGLLEMVLFTAVLGFTAWSLRRTRPVQPSPSAHPLTVRSPLRGGCFAATEGGGPAVNRYAQESLTPGAGRSRRYAVDLVQLGEGAQWRGRRALGLSPATNERYAIFGHPVLSPVDGVVVTAMDGLPDHAPYAAAVDHPEGNHVAIDTGRAVIVLSRLRHDSVRVRRGQHVTAGVPVGAVGNSGDGTEPGLHVRAETRTSHATPGGGVGLPFRFADVRGELRRGRRFTLPD